MSETGDYVLGTHDEEVERLRLQHRVWRPWMLDAWRRAGFAPGNTIVDVGSGPGYATFDLAETVGGTGSVIAVDRSRRFLDALADERHRRGLQQISTAETDLDVAPLPDVLADGAWCRWVLTFVRRPRRVLANVAAALRPGAVLVAQEYFDYATWRMAPPSPEVEEFVLAAMESWRSAGGDPDVGLRLPRWLHEVGFEVESIRTIVDAVSPGDGRWQWLASYLEHGRARLVELGHLTPERSRAIWEAFVRSGEERATFVITPGVIEILAVRR